MVALTVDGNLIISNFDTLLAESLRKIEATLLAGYNFDDRRLNFRAFDCWRLLSGNLVQELSKLS